MSRVGNVRVDERCLGTICQSGNSWGFLSAICVFGLFLCACTHACTLATHKNIALGKGNGGHRENAAVLLSISHFYSLAVFIASCLHLSTATLHTHDEGAACTTNASGVG